MVATTVREIHNWTPDAFARAEERVAAPDGLSSREPVPSAARGLEEGFCLRCGMKARACPSCGDLSCSCKRSMGEGMRQHYETDGSPRRVRYAPIVETAPPVFEPEAGLHIVATVGGRVVLDEVRGGLEPDQERDIAVQLLKRNGCSTGETAARLGISASTVLRVMNRTER